MTGLELQHVETGAQFFWHCCGFGTHPVDSLLKREVELRQVRKKKACLSEIVMLKPGGHFRGSLIISKSLCQMLVIRIRTVGWQKRAHNLHFMLLDLIYFVWHTHTHPHTSALSEKWCRSLLLQLFCCCGCVYPQQYYTRPLSLQPRREKASSITCCVVLCWHGL